MTLTNKAEWDKLYTVRVNGGEVNDFYLSKRKAKALADKYRGKGHTDVAVQRVYLSFGTY
jgi:hypothetical protein